MKLHAKLVLVVLMLMAVVSVAQAGHYQKDGVSVYLDGKVHVRFDNLFIGSSRDGKSIDKIRYRMVCLAGKAILNNVEYIDSAIESKESTRWTQSNAPMNVDFSARIGHLEKSHIIRVYRDIPVKITPYSMDNGKIRFHIHASGRDYKVTWEPKSDKVYASW